MFCSGRCSALGHMLVDETEIVSARRCGISWTIIAADLSVSVATIQRACLRADAPVELPDWITREPYRNSP
jgi:hypothetical protein